MGKNYISVSGAVEVVPGADCDDIYAPSLVFATSQNDLGPVGSDRQTYLLANLWILKSSNDINLTGLQGGKNGRVVKLLNLGSFTISLVQENSGSQATNRFNFAQDLAPGEGCTLQYSQALGRWFQPQTPGSGGGGGAPTTATYLLSGAVPGSLPNARQLLAGTNVTFDDSVAGQRTVNATGGGGAPTDTIYLLGEAAPVSLTNARQLLAGASIGFNDATPGQRTVGLVACACSAFNNAVQSIPDNSSTAANFNSENFDTNGIHSGGSPTRFTCPAGFDGIWEVTYKVKFAGNSSGVRFAFLRKNNTGDVNNIPGSTIGTEAPPSTNFITNGVVPVALVAGDYLELMIYQNSGGSLDIGDNSDAGLQTTVAIMFIGSGP